MKKILSVVLTLVMVLSTFAMLVPTVSAAEAEVFYEEDFSDASYAGKTGTELADAIFGAGNHNLAASGASLSLSNGGLLIDSSANVAWLNMVLSTDADISDGYIAEADYTFHSFDSTTIDGRFITFGNKEATDTAWANVIVVGPYSKSLSGSGTDCNARVGGRPGGAWSGYTSTYTASVTNAWDATYRMRSTICAEYLKLEIATYTAGVLGEYVEVATVTNQWASQLIKDILTFTAQQGVKVTVDNIKVTGFPATFPEAPAVTTSAGSVIYTQDFSGADTTLTNAALADAIFGAGKHNAADAGTVLSIVNGGLKIDTSAEGDKTFHGYLLEDAVISEGYIAEMDYTFSTDFATAPRRALNGRFLSFSTHGDMTAQVMKNWTIVGPYAPYINTDLSVAASGSPNARVATRPDGSWSGWTSTYGTSANVNTLGTTYRMRATITKDTLKLEVAKYTDGVLGDYVEIATAANSAPAKTLGDVLSICVQNENCVIVDNIKVTSMTSTPVNTFAGYQESANALRLVGVLDGATKANATAVGFKVAILGKGEFKDLACNYVYETIDTDKTAASLHAGYDYIYAMHIEAIPAGEYSVMVVPYYVEGGATVYGEAKTFLATIADAE